MLLSLFMVPHPQLKLIWFNILTEGKQQNGSFQFILSAKLVSDYYKQCPKTCLDETFTPDRTQIHSRLTV